MSRRESPEGKLDRLSSEARDAEETYDKRIAAAHRVRDGLGAILASKSANIEREAALSRIESEIRSVRDSIRRRRR